MGVLVQYLFVGTLPTPIMGIGMVIIIAAGVWAMVRALVPQWAITLTLADAIARCPGEEI